ncbi:NAD-dependent epimerase/dehydratase family protein [Salinirubrum litoreum]|uniref:NAD-dependent epimerase/dehydratase family protein n=1 Tax=Salinirubrum litoreum TaxID=1126234 RepID=A0ABD5RGJ8_9EURY|nr:NAD(P)-dependent oxidoreductase [Salinirubrum litoreum]
MATSPDSVVVTGALGGAGRWVVDRLLEDGIEIVAVDRELPTGDPPERVDFRALDLVDAGETMDLLLDVDPDAVVHLAAIPDPLNHAGERVYRNNVQSTYNVMNAAGRVGADLTWTSSESAYGFPFADDLRSPDSLPIDESHPLRPEDPYGLSKVTGEETAKAVVRRDGISAVSIRPSWVQYPGEYFVTDIRDAFELDALAANPTDAVGGGPGNFWSYVDVRDLADQIARSLHVDIDGHEAVHCHATDNYLGVDTADLFEVLLGEVPEPCDLSGDESAFSTAKARRLLDWEPAHGWRTESAVDGPDFGAP